MEKSQCGKGIRFNIYYQDDIPETLSDIYMTIEFLYHPIKSYRQTLEKLWYLGISTEKSLRLGTSRDPHLPFPSLLLDLFHTDDPGYFDN